ncbi:MAG: CopG family transcriptional regulator [Clostridia bacterium]|nr:CopG family transcriptional regulator [Clostridia bacterium]
MSEKSSTTKILVTLPNEILSIYDELAKRNGMSRSAMINYALRWYLDYKESTDMLPQILNMLQNTNKEKPNTPEDINKLSL